jgi:hypothetical protein
MTQKVSMWLASLQTMFGDHVDDFPSKRMKVVEPMPKKRSKMERAIGEGLGLLEKGLGCTLPEAKQRAGSG